MNNIILYILVLFSILGGLDRLFGNRNGLGERFEEGFKTIGSLALSMIGIICLSPVIAHIVMPVLSPLSELTGADPSIFISSILGVDLGGYATSTEIAETEQMAQYAGLILGSMMGVTVSFTIPAALNLVHKEDFLFFTQGILSGIVTIPVGMIVGGILMDIPLKVILINLIPVIALSLLISFGLFRFQDKTIRIFSIIGKGITIISITGFLISVIDFVLGIELLKNMISFEEALIVAGSVAVVLSGAYPLFYIIHEKTQSKFSVVSDRTGLNQFSLLGILSCLANCVPMLGIYDKMDNKGKVINAAFAVSGAFILGGQFGYVSSISPEIITAYFGAKLSAGISAILLANLLVNINRTNNKYKYKIERSNEC